MNERFIAIGRSDENRLLVIAFAKQPRQIKILSARQATSKEKALYEQKIYEQKIVNNEL